VGKQEELKEREKKRNLLLIHIRQSRNQLWIFALLTGFVAILRLFTEAELKHVRATLR